MRRERSRARQSGRPSAAGRGLIERVLRPSAPLLLGVLLASLLLVSLRVDILRMRYAKADALEHETRLRQERAHELVALRKLRDPARLGRLAGERGFARPERVIHLAPPGPGGVGR